MRNALKAFRSVYIAMLFLIHFNSKLGFAYKQTLNNLRRPIYRNLVKINKNTVHEIRPIFSFKNRFLGILNRDSSTNPPDRVTDILEPATPPKQNFKELLKKYGYTAVGTYLSIYILTLGSIFGSLQYDIFNAATFGLDPLELINKVCGLIENNTGNQSIPNYIRSNPTVGTFAVAWIMTKFTEPLRLGFTILIVPKVAKIVGGKKN